MKKKFITVSFAILLALAMFTGCASKPSRTFTVGFDPNFPPYGYMGDDGNYTGFDLELAAEVAKRNNWELQLKPIDWDAKDFELESGTIDCIWNGFTMSDARLDQYTWSKPYVDNSQVFVVRSDSGIKTFEDLKGKVVVVQADSSALEALQSDDSKVLTASFKNLIQVPDYNTAFMNLESGAADAIAVDIGVAKYQLESRGAQFEIMEKVLVTEKYAIGFKKGNTDLCEQVEKTLRAMVKDGTFKQISDKWSLTDSVIYEQ